MSDYEAEPAPVTAQRVCPNCGGILHSAERHNTGQHGADERCWQCGAAQAAVVAPLAARPAPVHWSEQRVPLLAMLFLGFGPFALPWLLRSGAFGRSAKGALSAAVTVYFALLCAVVWWSLSFFWRALHGG